MTKKIKKEPSSKQLFGSIIEVTNDDNMKKTDASLFDYINMLFKHPAQFTNLKPYEKGKNFFMMNRFFAMGFPIQSQMFNHLKINTAEATQYWCDSLSKIFNSTPGWIYSTLKKAKNKKEVKKREIPVNETTIIEYCKRFRCCKKDIIDAMNFFPDKMKDELILFENQINGVTLKKK